MGKALRSCLATLRPLPAVVLVGCGGATELEDASAGNASSGELSQDRGQADRFVPRRGNLELGGDAPPMRNALGCPGDGGGARGMTKICHATSSTTNPFVLVTVSNRALRAHRHHDGDIIPAPPEGCPGDTPPPEVCTPGSTAPCYDGPAGTEGVGACTSGTMTCNADGSGYGECEGSTAPVAEACGDGIDGDCDGNVDNGCITGIAWFDMGPPVPGAPSNTQPGGNGLHDTVELGIANVPILLTTSAGTPVASTLTDADGIYSFSGVAPGVYHLEAYTFVGQNLPAGTPALVVTVVSRGLSSPDFFGCLLFGICRTMDVVNGCASGVVYRPPTLADPVQRPIPDIPFWLKTGAGALIGSAVTDAEGSYSFECAPPGEYFVEMTLVLDERIPRNYVSATFANNPSDDTRDSDFASPVFEGDTSRLRTPDFTLTATAPVIDFDIGYADFND